MLSVLDERRGAGIRSHIRYRPRVEGQRLEQVPLDCSPRAIWVKPQPIGQGLGDSGKGVGALLVCCHALCQKLQHHIVVACDELVRICDSIQAGQGRGETFVLDC